MMKKEIYIYIDDVRQPLIPDTLWVKSYDEAIAALTTIPYTPSLVIDFDHDLGTEKTGYDLAKWLVANQYTGDFRVHSMYPVGHKNISELLKQYGWREFY